MARAPKANRKNKPARRSRFGVRLLLWLAVLGFLGLGAICVTYGIWASTFDMEAVKEMPSRSTVYDMDGKMYSRLQGENRVVIPLGKVSRNFIEALLAREDARFYQHRGVDPFGIVRAIVRNLISGSAMQGASTITQQLARNSFPDRISGQRKNAHRKLLEAFVALRIEQNYTKDEILENYVNRIYFGSGDLSAASKSASLDLLRQARQRSFARRSRAARRDHPRALAIFRPRKISTGALGARDAVLDRMVKLGQITEAKPPQRKPRNSTCPASIRSSRNKTTPWTRSSTILHLLLNEEQLAGWRSEDLHHARSGVAESRGNGGRCGTYGKSRIAPATSIRSGRIFPQEDRRRAGRRRYLQGAAMVIDNRSGGDSRRWSAGAISPRAITIAPSPAAAPDRLDLQAFRLRGGVRAGHAAGHARSTTGRSPRGEMPRGGELVAGNSDGTFKGIQHAEEGLIQSRNTMSVRVGERAGLDEIAQTAAAPWASRIMPQRPVGLSSALSKPTSPTHRRPTRVFPNNGVQRQSYIIERIDDAAGDALFRARSRPGAGHRSRA